MAPVRQGRKAPMCQGNVVPVCQGSRASLLQHISLHSHERECRANGTDYLSSLLRKIFKNIHSCAESSLDVLPADPKQGRVAESPFIPQLLLNH